MESTPTSQIELSRYTYGLWRDDKAKEPGFSHELYHPSNKGKDLDNLGSYPFPGLDTIYKAMQRSLELRPNNFMLGTKKESGYEWMTIREV